LAFYGSFAYVSLVLSGFIAFCVYNYGFETYTLLLWGKLLTLCIIFLCYITEISDDLYIMAEGTTHKVINLDQLRGYGYLK